MNQGFCKLVTGRGKGQHRHAARSCSIHGVRKGVNPRSPPFLSQPPDAWSFQHAGIYEGKTPPSALGRWAKRTGCTAAGILSLVEIARLNGIEPLAYLTDVLTRLPTHPHSRMEELLPTIWQPKQNASVYWPVHRVQQIAQRDRRVLPPPVQKTKLLGSGFVFHAFEKMQQLFSRHQ